MQRIRRSERIKSDGYNPAAERCVKVAYNECPNTATRYLKVGNICCGQGQT